MRLTRKIAAITLLTVAFACIAHAALFVVSGDTYPDGSWRTYVVYYNDIGEDDPNLPCRSNYDFGPDEWCTSASNCMARADTTHRYPKCNTIPAGGPIWP